VPDHPLPPDHGRNTVYERRKVDPAFARGKRVGSIREYATVCCGSSCARFSQRSAAKAGAGADGSEHDEHERNRRRVGVLSGVPERP